MKIALQMVHEYSLVFRETVYLKYFILDFKHHRSAGIFIILNFLWHLPFQNEQTEMKLHFLNAEMYSYCFITVLCPSQQLNGR